jgi:TldD protein
MKNRCWKNILLVILTFQCFQFAPIAASEDPLLNMLTEEIDREMKELSKLEIPPYYIDYRVDDIHSAILQASFGSLVSDDETNTRGLTAVVRVGDYILDNTHNYKGNYSMPEQTEVYGAVLPLENKPEAIKQVLWRITDKAYKNASAMVSSFMNNDKLIRDKSELPDFSRETASVYFENPVDTRQLEIDKDQWIKRLKEYTNIFSDDSLIFHCEATYKSIFIRNYFVSTEGSSIVQNSGYSQIQIVVSIQHEKGTLLPVQKSYVAIDPSGLPAHELILRDLNDIYKKLKEMRNAALAEPYAGPAILSPEAAGVFFHEIFGHRIEGHRLQNYDDGQTFREKINDQVLPKGFNVYSDPGLKYWDGQYLIGEYDFDDQGIKGQRVTVIENGKLKNFLMSRRPMGEFHNSNGHGRAQAGFAPVSRQSNLIIENKDGVSMENLRKKLIQSCKKQDKEYGYLFKEVVGGLTFTDRYNPNVFNINPTEVYKVYVDGRPDELVVGVDLIGTPLTMFSNILAASREQKVFTGFCGAESGYIPVSTIAPAIFVDKIETQKTPEYESELPVLPGPSAK